MGNIQLPRRKQDVVQLLRAKLVLLSFKGVLTHVLPPPTSSRFHLKVAQDRLPPWLDASLAEDILFVGKAVLLLRTAPPPSKTGSVGAGGVGLGGSGSAAPALPLADSLEFARVSEWGGWHAWFNKKTNIACHMNCSPLWHTALTHCQGGQSSTAHAMTCHSLFGVAQPVVLLGRTCIADLATPGLHNPCVLPKLSSLQALATLQSAPSLDRAALGRVVGALRARAAALLWHLVVAQVRQGMH
jgi:hypothetical protein